MPINEKHFKLLTDNAVVGVYIVNKELLFQYVNPALASMLGYRPEELIGTVSILSVIHPDEIPLIVHNYQQRLSGEVPSAHYETRAIHKSGRTVNIEIFAAYIDSKGERSLAGTVINITARIAAEEELLDRQQELQALNRSLEMRVADALAVSREKERMVMQQSRFSAMGEMVAGISHQWRQPLNMLGMSVQALHLAHAKGTLTEEFMKLHYKKSLDVLKYMSQTIDDFRNFCRPDEDLHPYRLDEAIGKIVDFFVASVNDIAVTTDACSRSTIYGHYNELSQVMFNILNNSRDAVRERNICNPSIEVTVTRDNDANQIIVTDNGGGIPEQLIDRVFDPFFSTKDPSKATGLGLYLVKSIVEKIMEGSVSAKNTESGAEISITLPLHGIDITR
ncbi:MAG: PAS domain-containing sensor histidine kinase [Desulfuromonadaceae bacterium]|nr:PAS domain-containing sensor histidine kinase [Desulfuromonadaceae bacterium]